MKKSGYFGAGDLYYSRIYGGGVYEWKGQMVQDPLGGAGASGCLSPLLVNPITKESFYMKRTDCSDLQAERCCDRILRPPRRSDILWPCDMVELTPEQQARCTLFAELNYTERQISAAERPGNRGLLFPYGGYPPMTGGLRRLTQIRQANWQNPEVRRLAFEIACALDRVNRCGYLYLDLHFSRFFFREDQQVYLDYSNLIYTFRETERTDAEKICAAKPGAYPIEFADPSIVQGIRKTMDEHAQNYSLCAMLFYLLFGQYPYDGRLLTGYVDDSPQTHYVKFRDYHKMPVFIFDPEDRQNALGAFDEEQQVIALWEQCPEMLRKRFMNTLRQDCAERRVNVHVPTPGQWVQCFKELGWA